MVAWECIEKGKCVVPLKKSEEGTKDARVLVFIKNMTTFSCFLDIVWYPSWLKNIFSTYQPTLSLFSQFSVANHCPKVLVKPFRRTCLLKKSSFFSVRHLLSFCIDDSTM